MDRALVKKRLPQFIVFGVVQYRICPSAVVLDVSRFLIEAPSLP